MKTIIAGSRTMRKRDVDAVMASCPWAHEITEVVSGCAPGADRAGELWAGEHDLPVKAFPALWEKYGRSAGYRRNDEMAKYAEALVVVWDGSSRGTANMIEIATKRGLKIWPEVVS